MQKKRIWKITTALVLLMVAFGAGIHYYRQHIGRTRIAFINYSSFHLARIQQANPSPWIRIVSLPADRIEKEVKGFDAVYVFGRGLRLTATQLESIREAGYAGVPLFAELADPDQEVTNLEGQALDDVNAYLRNGGGKNYRNLLLYTRSVLDGKTWFAPKAQAPVMISKDVLFHLDDDVTFETVDGYEQYLKTKGIYKSGAAKIALLTSVPGPFNANRDHLDAMIRAFQTRGWNVYPIASTSQRLRFLKQVHPDLVVEMPHGRLSAGDADKAVAWLKEQDIPMLSPLSIFGTYDDWMASPQGMNGGLLTMSVVLPEVDGGVAPYALAAQFKDDAGYDIYKVIPGRLEKFCTLMSKWLELKRKRNKDKRIAIYYFKGPGLNSLAASNMEVVPSLYHTLQAMKQAGYTVNNLPPDAGALQKMLQLNGAVLEPYAEGTLSRFFKEANPALVPVDAFEQWASADLTPSMRRAVREKYGSAPGVYMATQQGDKEYIGVARISFGNVVLLPQPLPGLGDDTFRLVHGAKVAPPYPYIASYLWTRNAFKADAILHFGTHGSLEFTPGKQVALSDEDWSDALIGSTPHFYVYTMSNVAEAIIAKRRSYATIISHLTAPFMQSGTYNELAKLEAQLHRWESIDNAMLKDEYGKSISLEAKKAGLYRDIGADTAKRLNAAQLKKLSDVVEEVDNEKVTKGLYTLGKPYTPAELDQTITLMSVDPIAYGLAQMDVAKGRVNPAILEDQYAFDQKYRSRARKLVAEKLAAADTSLAGIVNTEDERRALSWLRGRKGITEDEMVQGFIAMDAAGTKRPARRPSRQAGAAEPDMGAALTQLVIRIKPYPEKVRFLKTLTSEKRFKDATSLLDPATLDRAQKIAVAIPKMKAAITTAQDTDVRAVLRLIQVPALKEKLFVLLDDRRLDEKVALEKGRVVQAIKEEASTPGKQRSLQWLRTSDPRQLNMAQLRSLLTDLSFFSEHRDVLGSLLSQAAIEPGIAKINGRLSELGSKENAFAQAFLALRTAVQQMHSYRAALQASTALEVKAVLNAFNGGYTPPSVGGDPVASPAALPTGRNMYSIDAEKTPSAEGWAMGVQLAEKLLETYRQNHGSRYPRKVALTLWAGDFIQTDGAMMAEVFYLLGIEPVRDAMGKVTDVRLIPAQQLKRPRVDVLVQTSGQFRDLAASRIALLNKAVAMAAQAGDGAGFANFVKAGALMSERLLKEKGFSPKEARELATVRVFGGVDGSYGSGIMGMVEHGDSYTDANEVADTYIRNMGAVYDDDKKWAVFKEGLFETALQQTDVVLQPRQSNTWGPLSLDHVYEFAGGLDNAVRKVTGKEPEVFFSDFRNPLHARIQNMKEAIWVEARSTLLNPAYLKAMMAGGSSSAETFAETFRNTFGWNVMKTDAIDKELWDELHRVYVEDGLRLGTEAFFRQQNPYALEEMTGVLMEAHRKGLWQASDRQLRETAALHARLTETHGAGCSAFVCGNASLRAEMNKYLSPAERQNYGQSIDKALKESTGEKSQLVLKKEGGQPGKKAPRQNPLPGPDRGWYVLVALAGLGMLAWFIYKRRKRNRL